MQYNGQGVISNACRTAYLARVGHDHHNHTLPLVPQQSSVQIIEPTTVLSMSCDAYITPMMPDLFVLQDIVRLQHVVDNLTDVVMKPASSKRGGDMLNGLKRIWILKWW
jgi:hypothetical protein